MAQRAGVHARSDDAGKKHLLVATMNHAGADANSGFRILHTLLAHVGALSAGARSARRMRPCELASSHAGTQGLPSGCPNMHVTVATLGPPKKFYQARWSHAGGCLLAAGCNHSPHSPLPAGVPLCRLLTACLAPEQLWRSVHAGPTDRFLCQAPTAKYVITLPHVDLAGKAAAPGAARPTVDVLGGLPASFVAPALKLPAAFMPQLAPVAGKEPCGTAAVLGVLSQEATARLLEQCALACL